MKPKSKKPASVPQPVFARSFLPQKSLPSMPVWLVHWRNCASSDAATLDPQRLFRLVVSSEWKNDRRINEADSNIFLSCPVDSSHLPTRHLSMRHSVKSCQDFTPRAAALLEGW